MILHRPVVGFAFAPPIYFLFPETKNRSLEIEEIEGMFRSAELWWQVPSLAPKPVRSVEELELREEEGVKDTIIGHVENQKPET